MHDAQTPISLTFVLILFFQLCLGLMGGWRLPSVFPTETLHAFHTSPKSATRPARQTFIEMIFLYPNNFL